MSIEESKESLLTAMSQLGFGSIDENKFFIVDIGRLRLEHTDADVGRDWFKILKEYLRKKVENEGVEIVVVDSLTAIYSLATIQNPRQELFHFFGFLKRLGVTTFLISEMQANGNAYVFENKLQKANLGAYLTTDRFRVGVEGGVVRYRKNGVVVYESTGTPIYPLLVDTSIDSTGGGPVRPVLRLQWAEQLSQFDAPANFRNLSSLPRWAQVEPPVRRSMQTLVDWLYGRVDARNTQAVGLMHDLIRMCLLLASHAPVNQIIAGHVEKPTTVKPGSRVPLVISPGAVRVGMQVSLYAGALVVAQGLVEDVGERQAVAHIQLEGARLPRA